MDIRQPNITAKNPQEQLVQMRSYLYQLSQQLQWAFNTLSTESASGSGKAVASPDAVKSGGNTSIRESFPELKALIIKSADIVNAYYEEINRRLTGEYLAISDFGVYKQETQQEIRENSEGITRAFSNLQVISDALSLVEEAVTQVNAWIKTGKLGEDENGTPIYGVEIGQQTEEDGTVVFQKFARLMANRLSFFDQNGVEVSYIGDETMHITRADIQILTAAFASVQKIQLGDYLLYAGSDGHLTLS